MNDTKPTNRKGETMKAATKGGDVQMRNHAETLDDAHRLTNRLIRGTALPDDLDDECATIIRTLAYIVEAQDERLAGIADSEQGQQLPCSHDGESAVQCAQCGDWSITDPCVFCRHGVTEMASG